MDRVADLKERTQAFEAKCLMKLPRIFHLERKANDWVRIKTN